MTYTPTAEQTSIVDAFGTGTDLCIEAGAGTGKTSTLKLLAKATPRRAGVYLAFNKAIASDAAKSFPSSVVCKTAHAFAFAAVGRQYSHRLNAARLPARLAAQVLGITQPIHFVRDKAPLSPAQLARIALSAVNRFCQSADIQIERLHVPRIAGLDDDPEHALVQQAITPIAIKAWEDINHTQGRLRFEHSHYLKMWSLTRPNLRADYVLFDEAQDASPVIAAIVEDQQSQKVVVGDRCQAIYGFTGARDAMEKFEGQRLYLSQSFRFGQAIAEEANKWLYVLGATLRLRGFNQIQSTVGVLPEPDAILCRTNAGAFARVVDSLQDGRRTALVGGGDDIKRLAEAAQRLQLGQPCDHPELLAFNSWAEVRDYAENDTSGSDLKVFVSLVDKLGADEIVRICARLTNEANAQTVVSTAHKAKGREWDRVRIASDFQAPGEDPDTGDAKPVQRDAAMLAYVSVTRAKLVLDRRGLAWIDDYLTPALADAPTPVAPAPTQPTAGEQFDAITAAIVNQPKGCGCMLCDPSSRDHWPAPLPAGVS